MHHSLKNRTVYVVNNDESISVDERCTISMTESSSVAMYMHVEAFPSSSDGCWSQEQRCFRKRRERILTLAENVLGTRKLADRWLAQRAFGLGHVAPCYLLSSAQGYQQVKDFLAQLEYGVYC